MRKERQRPTPFALFKPPKEKKRPSSFFRTRHERGT